MSGLTKSIWATSERGDFESRLWRISELFVKESLSIFSSENRADGAESTEASFSPGLVVGCCGCRYFSRRSFFLHVELYLTGRRGKSLDSAGNSTGTTDFT